MLKRLSNSLIGMIMYTIVAYGGNLITGVAKHSSFLEVLLESVFFGIFVFLLQSFKQSTEDKKKDQTK